MHKSFEECVKRISKSTEEIKGSVDFLWGLWSGAKDIKQVYKKGEMRESNYIPPKDYSFKQLIGNGVNLEILTYKEPSDKVVLMVHGGSFIYRMADFFLHMFPYYAEAGGHATVVTMDYRVAPVVSYREMIEDVVGSYEWLLNEGYKPENIVFAGDSSGGGTTLASMIYLREHNYPMPAGVITISACTNIGCTTKTVKTNFDVDLIFGNTNLLQNNYSIFLKDDDYKNPYVSPFFGSYEGFPPMLLQVGGDEILLDDSRVIAQKAFEAGVDVRLEIYEGMFHDFQNCKGMLKEADIAWRNIGKFLNKIFYKKHLVKKHLSY